MTARGPIPGADRGTHRPWAVLAIVLVGVFVDSLDATMLTVILPTVREDLGASDSVAQWAVAGYLLAFALLLVTGGRCGDVFGQRRTFLVGVAVFGAASLACGLSGSGVLLAVGRVVQGAGAALMVPQATAVVTLLFPRARWPVAFGVFGAVLSLGSVCGPIVGGLLTSADLAGLGWRAAFLVNVPVCAVALVLGARLLPDRPAPGAPRLDLRGVLTSTAAAAALLVPLVNGRELGWPTWTIVVMLAAPPLGVLFWRGQHRLAASGGAPLIPPALFAQRGFGRALLVILVVYAAMTSLFLVVSFGLQSGLRWGPLHTAVVTAAWPVGIALTFQVAWRAAVGRERWLVGLGCLLMATGVLGLAAALGVGQDSTTPYLLAFLVVGGGMGLVSPVLTALALTAVPRDHNGAGSGVVNAVIQLGGAVGVAALGTVYFALADTGRMPTTAAAAALMVSAGLLVVGAACAAALPVASDPSASDRSKPTRPADRIGANP